MNLSKYRLCAAFAVLFLAGVGSVICRNWGTAVGDLAVSAKPSEKEIVGRWRVQSTSMRSITNRTGKTLVRPELTIRPDGRFSATDFPVEDSFRNPRWRLKSGEGYWELSRSQYWVVDLGFLDGF